MYNILFIESGEKLIQKLDNQTHAFQTVIVIIGFFSRIFFLREAIINGSV